MEKIWVIVTLVGVAITSLAAFILTLLKIRYLTLQVEKLRAELKESESRIYKPTEKELDKPFIPLVFRSIEGMFDYSWHIKNLKNLITEIESHQPKLKKHLDNDQLTGFDEKVQTIQTELKKEEGPNMSIVDPALKEAEDILKGAGINISTKGFEGLIQTLEIHTSSLKFHVHQQTVIPSHGKHS
ncbi:MAG: hypothetical protein GKS05_08450 [Nitrospirales bacterium]|nr:hypothetical protein [Nitrospirales bacterium]